MRFRNAAALVFALLGGCVADAGLSYQAQVVAPAPAVQVEATAVAPEPAADVQVEATVEEPELVEVDSAPGVQVVYDTEVPVFYTDNFYWRFDGGIWYRSSVHTGGWAVYNDPPERIRHIDRPTQYAHYRPATYTPRAQRPGYVPPRRVGTTTAPRPANTYGGRPATTTTVHSPTTNTYQPRPTATTTTIHSPTNTGYQPAPTRPATTTYGHGPTTTTTTTGGAYGSRPTTTTTTTTTGGGYRPTTPTTARPAPAARPTTPAATKTPPKKGYEKDKK